MEAQVSDPPTLLLSPDAHWAGLLTLAASAPPTSALLVYFQPGTYVFFGEMVLPPWLELVFAPGAVVVLGAASRLVIQGPLQAGLHQLFELHHEVLPGVLQLGSREFPSLGPREVYPEWFGAVQPTTRGVPRRPINVARAISDAIETAWRRRVLEGIPPLPVVLTGSYALTEAVVVQGDTGDGRPATEGLLLRGTYGGGLPDGRGPNLLAAPGFTGPALLWLGGVSGATVEGVSFSAERRAPTCVAVLNLPFVVNSQGIRFAPLRDMLFRGCLFEGATERQLGARVLWADGDSHHSQALEGSFPESFAASTAVPGLTLDGCRVVVWGVQNIAANGVEVRGSRSLGVRVASCVFEGSARWMLRAEAGSMLVQGCSFDNTYIGDGRLPEEGADVVLASPGPGSGAATAATINHCRSTSERLVCILDATTGVVGRGALPPAAPGLTLLQVEHQPRSGAISSAEPRPSVTSPPPRYSVFSATAPSPEGAPPVTLTGCQLGAWVVARTAQEVLVLDGDRPSEIFVGEGTTLRRVSRP
ncbi:MAG: hypothetical protein HY909_03430 [Deltaproteobacteria bacterium]|nr:hypothetical protein [Deltaproteobacteria bacterium]